MTREEAIDAVWKAETELKRAIGELGSHNICVAITVEKFSDILPASDSFYISLTQNIPKLESL